MNTPARRIFLSAWLALLLAVSPRIWAEENPSDHPQPPADKSAEAPAAPENPSAPEEPKSELRRLDEPAPNETVKAAEEDDSDSVSKADEPGKEQDQKADTPSRNERRRGHRHIEHRDGKGNQRVVFWGDATLEEGETADSVVSIFGSSTANGRVRDAVVSVFGSSTAKGNVGQGVVSVLGSSRVTGGEVGDVVVSILGSSYVNAAVHGDVVAVLGDVELGPDAVVHGSVQCVGGTIRRDAKAKIFGEVNQVGLGGHIVALEGLHAWVAECLRYARPLAFSMKVWWAWCIALGFFAGYLLVAALFPKSVEKCIGTFEQRPGYSILTALLTTLIAPLAIVLLAFTFVGAPILLLFLFFAGLFGKMVMIAWIGRRLTKPFSDQGGIHPALAVLVGGIVVLLLYTVPVVGFLVAKLLSWLGLGVVLATIILGAKRNRVAIKPVTVAPVVVPPSPVTPGETTTVPLVTPPAVGGVESPGFTGASASAIPPAAAAPLSAPPVIVSAATLNRAGFWIRIAASALDALLVGLAVSLIPHMVRPNYLLAYAGYCILLWGLRGTTVGGIVCNLKVVRLDDRRVDWPTALVRGLAGFLSLFAAGIGFIWVAFDDQRQSWHDKIAGTTIVQVPKGVSLV